MEQCLSSSVVWWGSLSTLVVSLILWVFALFQLSAARREGVRASLLLQAARSPLNQLGSLAPSRAGWGVSTPDFTETQMRINSEVESFLASSGCATSPNQETK